MNHSELKSFLDEKVLQYNTLDFIESDPVQIPHLFSQKEDIEIAKSNILLIGPTGSGKTTTLYSMMNELDKEKSNIVTLEDPVEYFVPGINQSQVKPEIGYTFANGLRTTLRQDPDVIFIGEIRERETMEYALAFAETGHLAMATLHAILPTGFARQIERCTPIPGAIA